MPLFRSAANYFLNLLVKFCIRPIQLSLEIVALQILLFLQPHIMPECPMSFGIISWAQVLDVHPTQHQICCFRDVIINYYINTPIIHRTLCLKVFSNKHTKTFLEICTEFNQRFLNDVLIIGATICFIVPKNGLSNQRNPAGKLY